MYNELIWYLNFLLSRKKLFLIIGSILVLSLLNVVSLSEFTKLDFITFSFLGFNKGYSSFVQFLGLLIFNGLPLYLIGVMMTEENFNNSMMLIRFKNIRKNFNNIQKAFFVFFTLYILVQLLVAGIIGYIFSSNGQGYIFIENLVMWIEEGVGIRTSDFIVINPVVVLFFASLLRLIELMMMQIIFIIFYTLVKNTVGAFLFSIGLYANLFWVSGYFPIGISSIQRLLLLDNQFIISCLISSGILISTYLLGYIYILLKGYKKIYQ